MSTYSSSKSNGKTKAVYDQHLTGEVVNNLTEAKQIANDYAANKRYPHRAKVSTVGNANVKPYYPIYLDGLPNGMSGYWTVLSVRHTFGGIPARYMLEMEVGTDIIGDVDPKAGSRPITRNVQAEIVGQDAGGVEQPVMVTVQLSPNGSDLNPTYGATPVTANTVPSATAIPEGITANMYAVTPPNFSQISRATTWINTTTSGVTNG